MGLAFDKLSNESKRAAFAHMDRARAGKATSKITGSGRRKAGGKSGTTKTAAPHSVTAPVTNPAPGGGFVSAGRISRERAAEIMFGTRGAAERIAKARKKRPGR